MQYFIDFPLTQYYFGDEKKSVITTDLSAYVSVIDNFKDAVAFYNEYYIRENERPDQLAFKLYDDPSLHWTFYAMNDNIRERGWPLTNREINLKIEKDFPDYVLVTKTEIANKFKIGQTISGKTSAATGTISHRNIDLGQLTLTNTSGTFTAGEVIESTNANGFSETILCSSYSSETLAVHHYENASGEWVDIDPTVGPGALYSAVTNTDYYISKNDELKEIRIIKPSSIIEVIDAFKEALKN